MLPFFALLPLQWLALAETPLGQARLHKVAILGLAALIIAHYPLRRYAPTLRTSAVFVVANLYLVAMIAAVQAYTGRPLQSSADPFLYLLAFIALSALFFRIAAGYEPAALRMLRYAPLILCTSLILGFSIAMALNGVNPAGVFGQAIATADPELFQKEIFKSAFAGLGIDEEDVRGNLRHEIFGSVLLSMFVGSWAIREGTPPTRSHHRAYRVGMLLGVLLLTLSLSRAILIAAMVWPVLAMLRSVRRGELRPSQIAIIYGAVVGLGGLLASGFGLVIYNRFFTDTTGYEGRAGNYLDAFNALPDVWVTGGYETGGVSSHNFVFDTLLRNGIFAALPAAIVLGSLLFFFVALAVRLPRLSASMVPVVAALVPPLVRIATSGGGLIPPIEWVALAFVVGVLAAGRRQQRETVSGTRSSPGDMASNVG